MARNKPKSTPDATAPETENPAAFNDDTHRWQEEMAGSCVAPSLAGEPVPAAEEQPRAVVPNPYPFRSDTLAGVTLAEDRQLRRMQLKFDEKPSEDVRLALKDAGFRWSSPNASWEVKIDREQSWTARAAADKIFKQVTEMIRQERGLTAEVAY